MERTFISLNAQGLRNRDKRRGLFLSLRSIRFTAAFLQECHLGGSNDVKMFVGDWALGPSVWSVGNVFADGLGFLFKGGVYIEEFLTIVPGKLLCVDVLWGREAYRLINVHAPCNITERLAFFKLIPDLLATNKRVVLGGDFNFSLDEGVVGGRRDFSVLFFKKEVLGKFSLSDCFRACGRTDEGFTWANSRGCRRRLDYFFVSGEVKPKTVRIQPMWASDHCLLMCDLEGGGAGPGRVWKFNAELLGDPAFVEQFNEFYLGWRVFKENFPSVLEWWEMVKQRIREFCEAYGVAKRREERERVCQLQGELQYWVGVANRGGRVNGEEVRRLKAQIRGYYTEKAKRFAFLAGVESREKDEKVTSYFFRTVHSRQKAGAIEALTGGQGEVLVKQQEMMEAAENFYKGLFGREERDEEEGDRLVAQLWREVAESRREALGGRIGVEEVRDAVFSLRVGKTPGKDGITRELYTRFWGVMANDLAEVYNAIGVEGKMPPSMREGVIHLLHKKGDRKDLGNWRPVTLLCTDCKVLGKVLANRAKKVLEEVLGPDQTCGVPGRMGSQNLILLRDVLSWARSRRVGVGVIGLDQQKAFDRVDHRFLIQVLEKMGFGEGFISWVKALYNGVVSRVKVNGALSAPVKQGRGVRQGCPLSPLLYVLVIEPLAVALRRDRVFVGLQIPGSGGQAAKVMQYADDTTVLVSSDRDLESVMVQVDKYCRGSGSKVNFKKSAVMVTEGWKGRSGEQHGLAVCEDGIKVLGVHFWKERADRKNWEACLERVKKRVELWKQRALTLSGRVLVVKADILSQVIYLARVFPIPASCKVRLTRQIFKFLWGGRLEPVRREILYLPVEQGGRGLVNVGLKLDVLFVAGIYETLTGGGEHKSRHLVKMWMGTAMRGFVGWDNRGPRAEDAPAYFQKAVLFLRAHREEVTVERLRKHRELYGAILEKQLRGVKGQVSRGGRCGTLCA